ncbi:enoyl-CoA hydratase/isomerase family protein [Lolliginicoccus suaedae]|uniref:enoyl-CoA hydratase/isomerase family protein n=1 Tax=Lolliginicoccus suaedae TaxID=2605429 RepID=UPI001F463BCA|nr:enoyl-CoA hydratase/isomerase family protein [Lolliginicoccus suaedae]
MPDHAPTSTVTARTSQSAGILELDKPKALNALDPGMIRDLQRALDAWRDDSAVRSVIIRSASPRAFCAGGDIRAIRTAVLEGRHDDAHAFFREEYNLNETIATYPKPFIALIDGAAMGGGLGVSIHGSIRVVTENALMAMPETAIGFFPDIGASYFLPRLAINNHGALALGKYLGLTGARVRAADALACGLATHHVPSARLGELTEALAATSDPAAVVASFVTDPGPAPLAAVLDDVEKCFSATTVTGIIERLSAGSSEWHRETLAALEAVSPRSAWITSRLVERGAVSTLRECLDRELALTVTVTRHPDFAEGVRAVLVDKDRNPAWTPATLAELDPADIDAVLL